MIFATPRDQPVRVKDVDNASSIIVPSAWCPSRDSAGSPVKMGPMLLPTGSTKSATTPEDILQNVILQDNKLELEDGASYEGQMLSGKKHGMGTFSYANGSSYTGQWVEDMQEGVGFEHLSDGSQYEGEFRAGLKEGEGTFTWTSGGQYRGEFVKNQMDGRGRFKWKDGREYTGDWRKSVMGPYGEMVWPNGRRFEGGFVKGKMHGEGRMIMADGKKVQGKWAEGVQLESESYNGTFQVEQGVKPSRQSKKLQKLSGVILPPAPD